VVSLHVAISVAMVINKKQKKSFFLTFFGGADPFMEGFQFKSVDDGFFHCLKICFV
jgi:hypothetical protein